MVLNFVVGVSGCLMDENVDDTCAGFSVPFALHDSPLQIGGRACGESVCGEIVWTHYGEPITAPHSSGSRAAAPLLMGIMRIC